MRKKIKIDGLGCTIFLCLFFAFSYCSVWGYQLFQYRWGELIYGGILAAAVLLAVVKLRVKVDIYSLLLMGVICVLLASNASFTYLLFYIALIVICISGRAIEYSDKISGFINFFTWVQLIGMFVSFLFPELYVKIFLPAFNGLDYYRELEVSILSRTTCYGFTCQNAHFAGFMVLGIGNRLIFYSNKNGNARLKNWIFVVLSAIGVYLSIKRAHFLFGIIALLVVCYLSVYLRDNLHNKFSRLALILSVCVGSFVVLLLFSMNLEGTFLNEIFDTIFAIGDNGVDITTGRVEFWDAALMLFNKNPWGGIGWKKFYNLEFFGKNYDVHNIYLQLLCEVGILGAIVFFLLFFTVLLKTISMIKKQMYGTKDKRVALFCCFYQIFFLLYGITGNPLYDASYYMVYFICLAMVISVRVKKS